MKSFELAETANKMRHLLFFVLLIGFSFSTIDKRYENLNNTINSDKHIIGDINVSDSEDIINEVSPNLEIEDLESLKNYSFTINSIYQKLNKIITSDYEIIQIKEKKEILDFIIENINEISKLETYNNFFYNEVIMNLIGIFLNYKNSNLNSKYFNKKIIPKIYNIIFEENNEFYHIGKIIKYNFLKECIDIFIKFIENKDFFLNLEKNKKLKKLYKIIINEYIKFVMEDIN